MIHSPVLAAFNDRPVALSFGFVHPERVAQAVVHFRTDRDATWREVPIARASEDYRAEVPAQRPETRWIGYYVTVTDVDHDSYDAFASRARPHIVLTRPSPDAEREFAELTYHRGQRLEFAAGGEYTNFGSRSGNVCGRSSGSCPDYYYTIYGTVQYHFFNWVRSITVRAERLIGETTRFDSFGSPTSASVGLFAATAGLEFRLSRGISLSVVGILGADDRSVTGGAGGMIEFGVDTPTRIQLAATGIANYGFTASAWMRWHTIPLVPLGAGVEVTNQPGGASSFGLRLMLEAGWNIGRYVTLLARGGFGTRSLETAGFTGGGVALVHF